MCHCAQVRRVLRKPCQSMVSAADVSSPQSFNVMSECKGQLARVSVRSEKGCEDIHSLSPLSCSDHTTLLRLLLLVHRCVDQYFIRTCMRVAPNSLTAAPAVSARRDEFI